VTLAKDLLGKFLIRSISGKKIITKIVETEAYVGPEDKACHAHQNKKTKRTEAMFRRAGHAYIYLIYGMYNCFNVVAGSEGKPEAVLVRAVEPVQGENVIKENRKIQIRKREDLTNGPGKLCQGLLIDRDLNDYDLTKGGELYLEDLTEENSKGIYDNIVASKRINIDYAEEYKDKLWRFYIKDNSFVSN
jgi:DNA-3-methyladenine glycosylase